jgi:hypothetical protein
MSLNVYMPTSSDNTETRSDLEAEIREHLTTTRTQDSHFLAHGDFNATADPSKDRLGYNANNKALADNDKRFNLFCTQHELTSADTDHTWHSHDFKRSAKLDHALHFPSCWSTQTTLSYPDSSITDHYPIHTQLPLESGTLPPLARTQISPRIRIEARKELSHLWQEAVETRLRAEPHCPLTRAQDIAIEEASAIYGLTNHKNKKSPRSTEQRLLQKSIATLRLIRRRIYGVLHAPPSPDPTPRLHLAQAANNLETATLPPSIVISPPPSSDHLFRASS